MGLDTGGLATPHVLVLLYYFPPMGAGGASIRTVKFLKYLSREGWKFTVITADPARAITPTSDSSSRFLLDDIPHDTRLIRVPAPFQIPSFEGLLGRNQLQ